MSQPSNKTRLYEALGQIVVSFKALEQALDSLILACMKRIEGIQTLGSLMRMPRLVKD
jgi:hypothetical protein